MKYPMDVPVKIVQLGAGGTGGHIAPHLYRLLYSLDRPVRYIICDGDVVKEKNLVPKRWYVSTRNAKHVTEMIILLGAVNNNKSRQLCHRVFSQAKELIYIDSGNEEYTGQVVCGVRRGGKTYFPPVGTVYPDVLEEIDKFPTELSCAEASVSAPQSIAANITAATAVVDSTVRKVTFSTQGVNVRPEIQQPRRTVSDFKRPPK